jgi:hypothetical protein
MIEEATGRTSGSVYQDRVLTRGEEGIVIKTHELDSYRYTHSIHLIRNPYDVIDSYFSYLKEIIECKDLEWSTHVIQSIQEWKAHTAHWLNVRYPVLRVRYEDLVADTPRELERVLSWLGYNISLQKLSSVVESAQLEKMREVAPAIGNNFFRRGQVGGGITKFNEEQRTLISKTLYDLLVTGAVHHESTSENG